MRRTAEHTSHIFALMARNPIVLVHGYSDEGASFKVWERILEERGYDVAMIHACSYRSLTNEVTIKDIAEGFDRALRSRAGLSEDEPFDAIVHSTGMLVMRAWLTAYAGRRDRLKHLIGLAPATFGSPLFFFFNDTATTEIYTLSLHDALPI